MEPWKSLTILQRKELIKFNLDCFNLKTNVPDNIRQLLLQVRDEFWEKMASLLGSPGFGRPQITYVQQRDALYLTWSHARGILNVLIYPSGRAELNLLDMENGDEVDSVVHAGPPCIDFGRIWNEVKRLIISLFSVTGGYELESDDE